MKGIRHFRAGGNPVNSNRLRGIDGELK